MQPEYEPLCQAIIQGRVEEGVALAIKMVEGGKLPVEIFSQCIEPTLTDVGDKFSRLEIFLPEMINAAEVVKAIQEAIRPFMVGSSEQVIKGRIVIATVFGDLHDIGKNIVKAMLEVNGYQVQDLGVDVHTQQIVKAAKEMDAQIIALSALMMSSLPFVRDVIDYVKSSPETARRFKVLVGGGCMSREWAKSAGADGYGENAFEAVTVTNRLMGMDQ